MSFASLPFVGLVAAGVILYYLVPKKLQWAVSYTHLDVYKRQR